MDDRVFIALLAVIFDATFLLILYGVSNWTGVDYKILLLIAIYAKIKRTPAS